MKYRTLGRTGWRVSVLGLGTGGVSLMGQRYEMPPEDSARLVRHALDQGVNMFDTAPGYGDSESRLGLALKDVKRDSYYLSTKFNPFTRDNTILTAQDLRKSLEQSLEHLQTDYIDLYYLHAVPNEQYDATNASLLEELKKARKEGVVRAIGISESYQTDHTHTLAQRAIKDGDYDALMVGLNLMSPDAVRSVLPLAGEFNIGIVVMCAVRTVIIDPAQRRAFFERWEEEGLLQPGRVDHEDPFGWLLDADAPSVSAAAYKYAATHPSASCVLTGTASIEHLDDNLQAVVGPPLSADKMKRIMDTFGPVQRNVQPQRSGRPRR